METDSRKLIAQIDTSEFFQHIFENSVSNAVLIFDTAGKILDINIGFQKAFGYSREECLGRHFSMIFIERDRMRNMPEIELTSVLQKGAFKDTNYILHRDGSHIWGNGESTRVRSEKGDIYIVKIIHDINEQKLMEQHLITSNELNETIIQSISEPLALLDENLQVQKANAAFFRFFQVSSQSAINSSFPDIARRLWDDPGMNEKLGKVLTESATFQDMQVELDHRGNGRRTLSFNARPIKDSRGSRNRILIIIRDITSEKVMEARREEFISYTSHELRTPITSIKAYLQLMERCIQAGSECDLKGYLAKAQSYLERINNLILDLHDTSKAITGRVQLRKKEFCLDDLVSDAVEAARLTNSSHTIIMEGKAGVNVYADKYRLQQVLSNLLSNAVKYSPGAGRIIVHTEAKNNDVTVAVKDFGIGIPKDKIDKLFKKFYRVEHTQNVEGLGLGLFISQQIIEAHNGRMWVESEEGKGSTFYFSIPVKG
jgi:two-component system, OmpR family, phosphate regulon sensor histidine kinase PhoR